MNTSIRYASILAAATLLVAAAAGDASAGGNVLQIDGDDIYIDLGAADGVGAGSKLTLMHIVVATDPVTNEKLQDRFPIGKLTVVKAGEHLCIATAPKKIAHRVNVGDEIELRSAARTFVDPWQLQVVNSKRRKPVDTIDDDDPQKDDPEARRIAAQREVDAAETARTAWNLTLGRDPADRIMVWQEFLEVNADSPYAPSVKAEIESLRAQMKAAEKAAQSKRDPDARRARLRVDRLAALEPDLDTDGVLVVRAPERVYEGHPIDLAFTILDDDAVDRAWLYYRTGEENTYERIAVTHDGDAYLRASIPRGTATPPHVEFFVEVAAAGGEPARAVGSQDSPRRIDVDARVEESPSEIDNRSRVTLFADYVEFDGFNSDFDQYFHAEIDFMYRFYKPIYSMRVGFGTMGGVGGPKDIIDDDPNGLCRDENGIYQCRRVAYNYAYTEVELRYSDALAFMLRPQLGTGTSDSLENAGANRCDRADPDADDNCQFFSSLGLRARVRFGEETSTNLILGFSVTEDVGELFEAAYAWSVIPQFPVVLTAQVTTQPVPEDAGVRLIADIGYRAVDWVYPSVRIAYQARDQNHAGLSAGLGANFDW